jgi:hypothetical protein
MTSSLITIYKLVIMIHTIQVMVGKQQVAIKEASGKFKCITRSCKSSKTSIIGRRPCPSRVFKTQRSSMIRTYN